MYCLGGENNHNKHKRKTLFLDVRVSSQWCGSPVHDMVLIFVHAKENCQIVFGLTGMILWTPMLVILQMENNTKNSCKNDR